VAISVLIILLFCLVLFSALFSAAETALFSLSSIKVKTFKQDINPRKRLIADLLSHPRDLLVTIIMLNVIVNILIQNTVSSLFGELSGWLLNVGVPLALVLIFGEVIPKSIGIVNNEKISYLSAPTLYRLQQIFFPIRRAFSITVERVSRVLFFFLRKEEEISVDELKHALTTSKEYGVLNEDEAEIVRGYLSLEEAIVKEFMRPRDEVIYYDIEEPLSKLVHLFVDQECTRVPVCRENLDDVLGIMSSRLFFLHRTKLTSTDALLKVMKKAFFVPESMSAKTLFLQMYDRREALAIVVDEYGSVSGLITLEDLVEEVIGEISDRRDEKNKYTRAGENVIIASGKLELSEFEEIFGVPLESEENMVTIGGWLTEQLGDIPKSGTKYTTEHFLFHVLAADPNRIRRLYIRYLKPISTKKRK